MKVVNGIHVYEKDEEISIPEGVPREFPVVSRFGFKLVKLDGRNYWQPGSEDEFRESEAERLGIKPGEVKVPAITDGCRNLGLSCFGPCSFGWCHPLFNPKKGLYYCGCDK
jgi:hypothetical protein